MVKILKFQPLIKASLAACFACICASTASTEVLTSLDFEDKVIPSSNGWSFGSQDGGRLEISSDVGKNLNGSAGSLVGYYPVSVGESYVWGSYNISNANTREVYVEFWAKMPNALQGFKFLKFFGMEDNGYANATLAATYSEPSKKGGIVEISFGDGKNKSNDTQNVIKLDGSEASLIGRSIGTATVYTLKESYWRKWDDKWHRFRVHIKFNSGDSAETEIADGAFYVSIDGKVYLDAKNIFNRHYSNPPLRKIGFFGWAQSGDSEFDIWYDDIVISTDGFLTSEPKPPVQ